MATLYMGGTPETVGRYVLFSGDPWRVNVIKQFLNDSQEVAFMREFNTCTGTYKGERITVTSTGIGAPSAAIAMEEMYACGMEVAAITANSSVDALEEQARRYGPELAVLMDEKAAADLQNGVEAGKIGTDLTETAVKV